MSMVTCDADMRVCLVLWLCSVTFTDSKNSAVVVIFSEPSFTPCTGRSALMASKRSFTRAAKCVVPVQSSRPSCLRRECMLRPRAVV
uniref:Putative secreted protein n=1 Tax=Ixodes ricinus TaxID=34613 RepID=A0A6B0UBF1_IXORI